MNRNYVFIIISLLCAFSLVLVGCGSDSGGGIIPGSGKAPGTFVISGAGGSTTDGTGGDGNYIEVVSYRDIIATTKGTVDASFTVPAGPTYMDCSTVAETETTGDMGEEFSPTVDTVVNAVDDNLTAVVLETAGEYYLVFDEGTPRLHVDSDNNRIANSLDADVDCVDIPAGVSVTFMLNNDYSGIDNSGSDEAQIWLSGDLQVAGTLQAGLRNTANGNTQLDESRGDLTILARQVFVAASGTVNGRGGDARWDDQDGGNGGAIDLRSNQDNGGYIEMLGTLDSSGGDDLIADGDYNNNGGDAFQIDLISDGAIYVAGTILAEGGKGENDAGGNETNPMVDLDADSHLYFTGTISTVGGNAIEDDGGDGGDIDFFSQDDSIYLAGVINTDGGMSGTGDPGRGKTEWIRGGDAGDVDVNAGLGTVVISTVMSAVGGDSRYNGSGGDGGNFDSDNDSGDFLFAGSFNGSGGKGTDTDWNCDWCTRGGVGGDFYVYVSYTSDFGSGEDTDPGDIMFGGNVTLAGGYSAGGNGGNGGSFYLGNNDYSSSVNPPGGSITLVGVKNLDFSGGDSKTGDGGDGYDDEGYALYVQTGTAAAMDGMAYAAGSIYWGVPVDISGGDGAMNGGYGGGDGGDVYFNTEDNTDSFNQGTLDTVAAITAPIDASGGDGDNGGDGGYAEIYAYNLVDISALLDVSGGNGSANGGHGSDNWSSVEIYATERLNMKAKLDVSGGDGIEYGGDSSYIYIQSGIKTTVTGGIDASGGDATDFGGDSGEIEILSQVETSSVTLGNIDITRGAGTAKGDIGYLLIDWMDFSPTTDEL